ncbi:hypothetical protein EV424DRAFT_1350471 [Suillus variegatus]|nr:hypothetical protein EV424DRAFT_1350471 [Suillus variegatus]
MAPPLSWTHGAEIFRQAAYPGTCLHQTFEGPTKQASILLTALAAAIFDMFTTAVPHWCHLVCLLEAGPNPADETMDILAFPVPPSCNDGSVQLGHDTEHRNCVLLDKNDEEKARVRFTAIRLGQGIRPALCLFDIAFVACLCILGTRTASIDHNDTTHSWKKSQQAVMARLWSALDWS